MAPRRVMRVQHPAPFGEVTVVPAALSGRAEAEMARAMAAALIDTEADSAANILGRIRQAFPVAPLAARLAAVGMIMDRSARPT